MNASGRLAMHRDGVLDILSRRRLTNPRLFGSAARQADGDGSDLDILVKAPPGTSLFDLAGAEIELEQLLGCSVRSSDRRVLAPDVRRRVMNDVVPLV